MMSPKMNKIPNFDEIVCQFFRMKLLRCFPKMNKYDHLFSNSHYHGDKILHQIFQNQNTRKPPKIKKKVGVLSGVRTK